MAGKIFPHIKPEEIMYNLEVLTPSGWQILLDQFGERYEYSHYWAIKTKRFLARMYGTESRLREIPR